MENKPKYVTCSIYEIEDYEKKNYEFFEIYYEEFLTSSTNTNYTNGTAAGLPNNLTNSITTPLVMRTPKVLMKLAKSYEVLYGNSKKDN